MGTGQNNMNAKCFPEIGTDQLHRVLDNRDLGTPDTVMIRVGQNILKRRVNVDCVVSELCLLVKKVNVKFPQSKLY